MAQVSRLPIASCVHCTVLLGTHCFSLHLGSGRKEGALDSSSWAGVLGGNLRPATGEGYSEGPLAFPISFPQWLSTS